MPRSGAPLVPARARGAQHFGGGRDAREDLVGAVGEHVAEARRFRQAPQFRRRHVQADGFGDGRLAASSS